MDATVWRLPFLSFLGNIHRYRRVAQFSFVTITFCERSRAENN